MKERGCDLLARWMLCRFSHLSRMTTRGKRSKDEMQQIDPEPRACKVGKAGKESVVDWDRRLASWSHHVHVVIVEPIEKPEIVSGHAAYVRSAG